MYVITELANRYWMLICEYVDMCAAWILSKYHTSWVLSSNISIHLLVGKNEIRGATTTTTQQYTKNRRLTDRFFFCYYYVRRGQWMYARLSLGVCACCDIDRPSIIQRKYQINWTSFPFRTECFTGFNESWHDLLKIIFDEEPERGPIVRISAARIVFVFVALYCVSCLRYVS